MKLFVVLGICITLIYGVSCHAKPCKRSANPQGGCVGLPEDPSVKCSAKIEFYKEDNLLVTRKRTVLRMEVKEVDRIKKDGNCCVRIHSGRFYRGTKKQFFGPGGYEIAPDFKNIRSLKVDNCLEFDEYNAENS